MDLFYAGCGIFWLYHAAARKRTTEHLPKIFAFVVAVILCDTIRSQHSINNIQHTLLTLKNTPHLITQSCRRWVISFPLVLWPVMIYIICLNTLVRMDMPSQLSIVPGQWCDLCFFQCTLCFAASLIHVCCVGVSKSCSHFPLQIQFLFGDVPYHLAHFKLRSGDKNFLAKHYN